MNKVFETALVVIGGQEGHGKMKLPTVRSAVIGYGKGRADIDIQWRRHIWNVLESDRGEGERRTGASEWGGRWVRGWKPALGKLAEELELEGVGVRFLLQLCYLVTDI